MLPLRSVIRLAFAIPNVPQQDKWLTFERVFPSISSPCFLSKKNSFQKNHQTHLPRTYKILFNYFYTKPITSSEPITHQVKSCSTYLKTSVNFHPKFTTLLRLEYNHNINLYGRYTAYNGQITYHIYRMDRSETYEYNLWHAYIKIRWRNGTFVLFTAKTTKLLENKTR